MGPGEFLGKDAVAARAADLARDLARAVKEGRRYPATDRDLSFWQFMSTLVKENRDFMAADYEHWLERGLFKSFEAYVGQTRSRPSTGPAPRTAPCARCSRRRGGRRRRAAQGNVGRRTRTA